MKATPTVKKLFIVTLLPLMLMWVSAAWAAGPVFLMGIDAEDGSPFNGHGSPSIYAGVV